MGWLKPLDSAVAQRMRAHAAVTDLSSAVAALMANSVDANATEVLITVDTARMSCCVSDNGQGVHPDDIEHVGQRRTTTKVRSMEQLALLKTRGFRGESLNALGSVCALTVRSKTSGFNGTYMTRIHNGERVVRCVKVDTELISGRCGTEVRVEQLFHNTPVRLKYLREVPEQKILQRIRDIVFEYAIGCPHVMITVRRLDSNGASRSLCRVNHEGKTDTPTHWVHALRQVYGIDIGRNYRYTTHISTMSKERVLISTIPVQTKAYQFYFLDHRQFSSSQTLDEQIKKELSTGEFHYMAEDGAFEILNTSPRKKKLATAVGTAYNRYPILIIDIKSKQAVRNLENGEPMMPENSYESVGLGLTLALRCLRKNRRLSKRRRRNSPTTEESAVNESQNMAIAQFALNSRMKLGNLFPRELEGVVLHKPTDTYQGPVEQLCTLQNLISRRRLIPDLENIEISQDHDYCNHDDANMVVKTEEQIPRDLLSNCDVISQVDDKFILIKSSSQSKLYIVDQHSCDERIRVEELYKDMIQVAKDTKQTLAMPLENGIITDASESTFQLLATYKDELETWGIKFISHGESSELVTFTHLPQLMHSKVDGDNGFIIRSILQYIHDLDDKRKIRNIPDDWSLGAQAMPTILMLLLNSKACRSAIMFGQRLDTAECELLVKKLSLCKQPFQCAHGRPSIVPLCDFSQL